MIRTFIRAAFAWILIGVFLAISCSFMSKREKEFQFA